jgi:uncharacterized protein (TIRG00374 family)
MNKDKRKKIFRFLYIIGTLMVIALIGIFDPSLVNAFDAFKTLNLNFILLGFLSLILFWVTDGLLLHHVTSYIYGKTSFLRSLKVGIVGLYYGALTPFATGGQPMQVVYMKRDNVPYGSSICIVSVKFIVYELSLCLFYVIAMLFRGGYFYRNYQQVFWLTTLGFVINLASVVMIVFIMINKNVPYKIGYGFVRFFHKLRLIKKPEKAYKSIDKSINDFHTSTEYIIKYKGKVAVSVLLSLINLIFLFAIPYFIYVAFGHREKTIIDLITMQSFLMLAVSFFPLPGASGASEGGFYVFFSSYFTNVPVFIPMIIWRFISYYSVLIVGCILIVADEMIKLRKNSTENGT